MNGWTTPKDLSYALITPVRNEEAHIGRTLQSVIGQTKRPIRWIIVSDASTDRTDQIIDPYTELHPWIELMRLSDRGDRSFAAKARAFNAGYQRLSQTPCDIIGNLDADVSFDNGYFAFLLEKFAHMPDLGVAGTPFVEGNGQYDYRYTSIEHVSGACQLFRRECLRDIGGYREVRGGGIDLIAVTTARMKGWKTRTFVEKVCVHHRTMGSAGGRVWKVWFRRGQEDYAMGGHPLWQLARSLYQMKLRPYLLGGLLLFSGYVYECARGTKRPISEELIRFHRKEQVARLKRAAVRLLPIRTQEGGSGISGALLEESIAKVERWVETHHYKGYEPFDGLSSYVRPLACGNQVLERSLLQVVRQSPVNIRPFLGIKPLESTKGRGYMAWGYLTMLMLTGKDEHRQKAINCLEWLIRNTLPLYPHSSWGNHFDFASRSGRYSKHESIIVWTALIGQAFLDGYETLSEERYLDVARDICRWILKLPREKTPTGECLSYLAFRQSSIHNANMLGAAMLARTAKHTRDSELFDVARSAMEYSCSRQLPDGAWYYAEDPRHHWIDNFHTGYNLDSLKCYIESTGDHTFRPQLELGFNYFKENFFEPSGRPKYYHNRVYPIDIQCAAQAIETLSHLSDDDAGALALASKVARWTIEHMQDPSGYFYYRKYPFLPAKIPMLHWGQATMYRALALLLSKMSESERLELTTAPTRSCS